MVRASSGLVAKSTSSPIPAARARSRSSIQAFGRDSSRSISARPVGVAYARNTPIWQLSILPVVPVYCRPTPADRVPFLMNPVSSTISTPPGPSLDHVAAQLIADRVGVPVRGAQQPLHPVRGDLAGGLGQRPAVLALQLAE